MGKVRAFTKRMMWSSKDEDVLRAHYPASPWAEMERLLPGRRRSCISSKAAILGICRPRRAGRTLEEKRAASRDRMATLRVTDPDGLKLYRRTHHHKNREVRTAKMRAYYARRFFWGKAMKLRGKDRATTEDLAALWKRQRGRCTLSGRRLFRENAHLDHRTAKARGGGDEIGNLQWLDNEVNMAKRALSNSEFTRLCADVATWLGERIDMVERLTAEEFDVL